MQLLEIHSSTGTNPIKNRSASLTLRSIYCHNRYAPGTKFEALQPLFIVATVVAYIFYEDFRTHFGLAVFVLFVGVVMEVVRGWDQ